MFLGPRNENPRRPIVFLALQFPANFGARIFHAHRRSVGDDTWQRVHRERSAARLCRLEHVGGRGVGVGGAE